MIEYAFYVLYCHNRYEQPHFLISRYRAAASSLGIELCLQHPPNTSAHFKAARTFFCPVPPLRQPRPEISRSNSTSTHQRLTNQSAQGVVLREWSVRLVANQRLGLVEQRLHVIKRWPLEWNIIHVHAPLI